MNKHLLYFSLLLAVLQTACSTDNNPDVSVLETTVLAKAAEDKSTKKGHKLEVEGVISLDIVNVDGRLHLLTGKKHQQQISLWYKNSDDSGKSWSDEVQVLSDDNLPAKIGRGNDAQIIAQGETIIVSWMKYVEDARFNSGPMITARSTDNGKTWHYTSTPPDWNLGAHSYIDMAADEHAIHAVWLDSRNGRSNIKASQGLRYAQSKDGGLTWKTNKTLDEVTCSCCWNTVKTDSEGNTYVLYRDKQPSDFSIGVINDQETWQRLNHVGAFNWQFEGCPHIGGGMDFQHSATGKRIHAIVGTGHPEHLGVHYLYSDNIGGNWSGAKQLGNESAVHADVAAHDNGRVVAVWDMMGEVGLAVFVAESKDQGKTWSSPKQLSKINARATHPRIVKTESGFFSLWTENDGSQKTLATKVL